MKDIVNPLLKAYYTALNDVIPVPYGSGFVQVYEGEEPDDIEDQYYIVLANVNDSDTSTKSSTGHSANIQVTINSWGNKYNNSKGLNIVGGAVINIIHPTPQSNIQAEGITIVTTTKSADETGIYGKLADKVFISRNIIFSHDIYY